ncbi:hypothetical protein STIUS_v1c04300 [Spiroplasma sp. TIUS-1]|uniref:lipoprotein n=1 Tax=Spiroplasma sp. TIUS-1 TaxID=216963 RepID=UPI001397DE99|nr:lipoprotein [Spiroplasma sp. TIUS-1]QHX35984.1 hypothetical protein STIUS_v1c04300 [Spiroplasma sp. TIUS-1]
MKKLISVFGALTITATTTIMVVSCANLDNYKEIKRALDNNESMIILISAEDCTHCKNFTYEYEKYNNSSAKNYDSFEEMINQITTNTYNDRLHVSPSDNEDEKRLTGFGEIVEKVTFKEYKSEKYENLFDEKWLVSLKDLIRDQLRELFVEKDDSSKPLPKKEIDKKINANYLDGIMTGTPTFLHFRHGRFIGTTNWDFKSLSNDEDEFVSSIETYVRDLMFGAETATSTAELWGDSYLSSTLYKKISEASVTEPDPEIE